MEIEVLVSTMNRKNKEEAYKLFKNMNIKGKALMINQITDKEIGETILEENEKRIYSYYGKGLSKSRNKAVEKMQGDIGIIADDDMIYNENYEDIIKRAYEKYKDADIIAFDVNSLNKKRKIRKQPTHRANFVTLMRITSVQITFKKNSAIKFDENFGAGAKYTIGEENIFLYDCRKLKKKIYYVNENIGTVTHENSTWYSKMDENLLKCEGAVLYRISPRFYLLLILQFALRKRKEYGPNISMCNAIKYLYEGAKDFKEN